MHIALILSTFIMGIVGGPHCLVMCGPAASACTNKGGIQAAWQFKAGRLLSYSLLGALAASSVQGLAWLTQHTKELHPLWTLFHAGVLAWGIILFIYQRQPLWINKMNHTLWHHIKKISSLRAGVFFTGMLWAFMPCGLLYSALLMASLNNSLIGGALSMAAFAIASGSSAMLMLWSYKKIKQKQWILNNVGMRLSGLLLIIVASISIWIDVSHQVSIWCA